MKHDATTPQQQLADVNAVVVHITRLEALY